ncbi:hypothetical protein [Paenibacillus sp. GYB003]|uniref:hypothetical protein n=1 Tax=Paenibacillus sp. GYB003 TaxID=2994392 RepID=UPI002F965255
MSKVCDKHISKTVKIYDQCVACEIESLISENTQLKYDAKRLREELEKYMKRVKTLLDGYDKIIEGEGDPTEIAMNTCDKAITLR